VTEELVCPKVMDSFLCHEVRRGSEAVVKVPVTSQLPAFLHEAIHTCH